MTCKETGWFSSVAVHNDLVYAAAYNMVAANKIYVLRHTGPVNKPWERVHRFSVMRGDITLSVQNDQIVVCSAAKNRIEVYSMSGKLQRSYGKKGGSSPGHLDDPIVCNDDDDGNLLVADYYNNRLQVMSQQGEFSIVALSPRPCYPAGAALHESSLFVTSRDKKTISKYR